MAVLPEIAALKASGTLIKAVVLTGKKGAEIINMAGGAAQAVKDFEALSGAKSINGAVRVKNLADGSRAVLYTATALKRRLLPSRTRLDTPSQNFTTNNNGNAKEAL